MKSRPVPDYPPMCYFYIKLTPDPSRPFLPALSRLPFPSSWLLRVACLYMITMSATAALTPHPPLPPPPTSQSHMLSRLGSSTSPLNKMSPPERPQSSSSKISVHVSTPSPPRQASVQEHSPASVKASPVLHVQSKETDNRKVASPVPVKLPDLAPPAASSPKEPLMSSPLTQPAPITRTAPVSPPTNNGAERSSDTSAEQTPSQLALLLSQALSDADALRRELVSEKIRAARAERLLAVLQAPSSPDSANSAAEARNADGRLSENAAKAILEAEARTEKAERARDEALHALAALSSSFAELERYEAACSLRASDARGAYSRLLTSLSSALPPAQSSPALSARSSHEEVKLTLPKIPPPLPSLPPVSQLPGPGFNLSSQHAPNHLARHIRPLPTHLNYGDSHNAADLRQANGFESLPLPPPPSATGLSSLNSGAPLKRAYSQRSRAEEVEYEEQKRRRLALDMDVEMPPYAPPRTSFHQSGTPSAQPLSGHPTAVHYFSTATSPPSRNYERSSGQLGYSPVSASGHHREAMFSYPPSAAAGSRQPIYDDREREYREPASAGPLRMDARELAREAKARERRERERESYVRQSQTEALLPPESQGALHTANTTGRRRSGSHSSTRSKSSLSLDEMLLETATEGGRGRAEPQEQPGIGPDGRPVQNHAVPQSINGFSVAHSPPESSTSRSMSRWRNVAYKHNRDSTKATPPVRLVIDKEGRILDNGGGDTPVDPAVQYPGLRTCRQCGKPGRYKDGKCVEKWGPGPQGPGTVCDRCRKKMKRVERRGTLEASSASLRANQSQNQKATVPLTNTQTSYSQSFAGAQSRGRAELSRAPASRADTLIIEPERRVSDRSRSPGPGLKYHASVPAPSAAARHPSLTEQTQYPPHPQSPHRHQAQSRRAPTPPYITTISSRDQNGGAAAPAANSSSRRAERSLHEHELLGDHDRDASRSAARYAHSESYARQHGGEERDELAEDADGDVDADADADGSGVGSADAEAEADIMDAVDATMKTED